MPVRVFIAYAQEDESFLRELEKHLGLLKQQGLIEIWTLASLVPGRSATGIFRLALARLQVEAVRRDEVGRPVVRRLEDEKRLVAARIVTHPRLLPQTALGVHTR